MRDIYQFYPTGERLAAKAWAKFKRPVRHLCDPSAGKGHLIRHAKEGFPGLADEDIPWVAEVEDTEVQEGRFRTRVRDYARQKFSSLPAVSVIEIDVQHHSSLKELGAKIIGYDFMNVSSLASISHVLMNPPFNQGCAHVLHAWDCVYDAELVAIINAETIRNPFSQDRQKLVSLYASGNPILRWTPRRGIVCTMKIMHTMANDTIAQRPKRRYYSPELKGQIVAECQVSGASVAGVALAHGVNANIVHRWMREQADSLLPAPRNEFVALNLPPPVEQVPASETSSPRVARAIHVEVRRSAGVVTVNWPLEDAASCAAWLRDWLR